MINELRRIWPDMRTFIFLFKRRKKYTSVKWKYIFSNDVGNILHELESRNYKDGELIKKVLYFKRQT